MNLEEDLASHLECPVCLLVPREGPIPSCPVGHIICKTCRESLDTCPTCRRPLSDENSNSLASALIDKVKHKCKFHMDGCDEKGLMNELQNHEKICPERTIICPNLKCMKEVKLKCYQSHVTQDNCLTECRLIWSDAIRMSENLNTHSQSFEIAAPPQIRKVLMPDGHVRSTRRRTISFKRFILNQKHYFLHYMITDDDDMTFYVAFAGDRDELSNSKVSLTVKSKDEQTHTTYCTKIVQIDEAPLTEEDLIIKREVWCLSKKSWSKLLSIERKSVLNSFSLFVSVS